MHEEILKRAEGYRSYVAKTLSEMVKISSYSGKEEAVCRKIKAICEDAGFDEVRFDGLGSVIARIGGGPRSLAFDAHIDTVEVGDPDQWEEDPFSGIIANGLVHGRGSTDQKGGGASMIAAGRILKDMNYSGPFTLYFTFTVMEEDCDGMCWKYLIEEEGLRPEFFVSTEPTSLRITRGHRGRMEMMVKLKGISAHGSAPHRGDSAAYKAARVALAMEELNGDLQPDDDNFLGKGTIVVSQIDVKGPSQCAVPDQAMLYLDRRLTWGEDADLAIGQVRDYAVKALGCPPGEVEVSMPEYTKRGWKNADYRQELYFPTWKIDPGHPLVEGGVEAYNALWKKTPVVDKWTFSTNAVATTGRHKIPAIGFGPGDESQAHAPNEVNRVDDLVACTAFYAMLPHSLEERL